MQIKFEIHKISSVNKYKLFAIDGPRKISIYHSFSDLFDSIEEAKSAAYEYYNKMVERESREPKLIETFTIG